MLISGTGSVERSPRYRYPSSKKVRIAASSDQSSSGYSSTSHFLDDEDATVHDISMTGMAVNSAAQVSTGQLVELHIDGVPPVAGNVVRAYNGMIAVQFAKDDAARMRVQHEVSRLNQVA